MDKYTNASAVFSEFFRSFRQLKRDLPIRPSEMRMLGIIANWEGDCTPLMLAEAIGVSKPMIAAHIQALFDKGYVCKEAAADDKRSFYVRPTENGRALAAEYEARQRKYVKVIEDGLGEAEFDELIRLLDRAKRVFIESENA